jgi:hypothetical protein
MKKIILLMLAMFSATSGLFASPKLPSATVNGITMSVAAVEEVQIVLEPKDGKANESVKSVVVQVYLENSGDKDAIVCLGGSPSITVNEDRTVIDYAVNALRSVDDVAIKPSLTDLRPVTLKKGERTRLATAKINIPVNTPRASLVVFYSVDEAYTEMYRCWSGSIEVSTKM